MLKDSLIFLGFCHVKKIPDFFQVGGHPDRIFEISWEDKKKQNCISSWQQIYSFKTLSKLFTNIIKQDIPYEGVIRIYELKNIHLVMSYQ